LEPFYQGEPSSHEAPASPSLLSRAHTLAEMGGVQTRKQKVMEAESTTNGDILSNGHTKPNGTIAKVEKTIYKQENIFVFIPNLIGRL
jgi:hypothetical protein